MKNSQKGFVVPLLISIIALLVLGGGAYIYTNNKAEGPANIPNFSIDTSTNTPSNIVGGDKDIHGCLGSAGYTWCAVKNKCLRIWEEECEKTPINSGPGDKDGFVACTMDAKKCADGSYVGRTGPNCEFVCPTTLINERASGVIKSVYKKAGKNYLDIDYVEFVSGGPNGVTGINNNPKIRTFEISNDAKLLIRAFCTDKNKCTGEEKQIITFDQFFNIFNIEDYSINNVNYFKYNPWDIVVKDNLVISITEHFVP